MDALDLLDAAAVHRWSRLAADRLAAQRGEIDALNVYPVPDRDTGTNLAFTLRAAADAVESSAAADLAPALDAMARGAVLGARGNSGAIVSQVLRGIAEQRAPIAGGCDGAGFRDALRRGVERAYQAMATPVEGTMLSVARAASDAAASVRGGLLSEVVDASVRGARAALERTTAQLPELTRAGVVDAGGRGMVLLLDALAAVVGGSPDEPGAPPADLPAEAPPAPVHAAGDGFAYEVQYLLTAPDDALDALRTTFAALGDSVAVAGTGDGEWSVHVHTDDVGAAIEAGLDAGRPRGVRVTRFADDPEWAVAGRVGTYNRPLEPELPTRSATAVLALVAGDGPAALLAAEGARVLPVVPGEVPSDDALLAAIRAAGAAHVVVLPDAPTSAAAVERAAVAARAEGLDVAVVRTRSTVQAMAALAVHDAARRFADDVVAMAEAAAATRFAEVLVARRAALTSVGRCEAGDVLGLIDGDVVEIGADLTAVTEALLARLLGVGGELLTLVLGPDAPAGLAERVRARAAEHGPFPEVVSFADGAPDVPVLIGLE